MHRPENRRKTNDDESSHYNKQFWDTTKSAKYAALLCEAEALQLFCTAVGSAGLNLLKIIDGSSALLFSFTAAEKGCIYGPVNLFVRLFFFRFEIYSSESCEQISVIFFVGMDRTWPNDQSSTCHWPSFTVYSVFRIIIQHYHNYDTRNRDNLHLARCKTSYGLKCIKYKGSNLWNQLPSELKLITSINSFKCKLKTHTLYTVSLKSMPPIFYRNVYISFTFLVIWSL